MVRTKIICNDRVNVYVCCPENLLQNWYRVFVGVFGTEWFPFMACQYFSDP